MSCALLVGIGKLDGCGAILCAGILACFEPSIESFATHILTIPLKPAAAGLYHNLLYIHIGVSHNLYKVGTIVLFLGDVDDIGAQDGEVVVVSGLEHCHNHIELLVGNGHVCRAVPAGGVICCLNLDISVAFYGGSAPTGAGSYLYKLVGDKRENLRSLGNSIHRYIVNQCLEYVGLSTLLYNLDLCGVGCAGLVEIGDLDNRGALLDAGVFACTELEGTHKADCADTVA